jgi:hypothetical protein
LKTALSALTPGNAVVSLWPRLTSAWAITVAVKASFRAARGKIGQALRDWSGLTVFSVRDIVALELSVARLGSDSVVTITAGALASARNGSKEGNGNSEELHVDNGLDLDGMIWLEGVLMLIRDEAKILFSLVERICLNLSSWETGLTPSNIVRYYALHRYARLLGSTPLPDDCRVKHIKIREWLRYAR